MPSLNPSDKQKPNETPTDMQERMRRIADQEITVTSTPAQKQGNPPPIVKANSSNDLFTTLREKREKHKKEKFETKVEGEALKELPINKIESAPITTASSINIKDKKEKVSTPSAEDNKEPTSCKPITINSKNDSRVSPQKEAKDSNSFTDFMNKGQADSCNSILNSSKKLAQYTPSVTPSLFELYVNGDQGERMDLNSMLEHMSQYIYAFCIISIITM